MERSRSPSRGPGTARAGSEQECSAQGWARAPVTHGSSSQSHRSVCPAPALGVPGSCHPTLPASAALKHSIQEPRAGQSWAAPSASSSSAASRLPKRSKNENPKARGQAGWAPRCTLQRAVIALHSPGTRGRAGAELLGLSPPGSPHLSGPGAGQGEQGQPWGMWGCSKSRDQPRVGAQPRERGVRAELLHSHCPGPCGRGGSARSPPRGDIRGPSTKPALGRGRATGDCTWGGAGTPPGAQREGHSSTQAQMLLR